MQPVETQLHRPSQQLPVGTEPDGVTGPAGSCQYEFCWYFRPIGPSTDRDTAIEVDGDGRVLFIIRRKLLDDSGQKVAVVLGNADCRDSSVDVGDDLVDLRESPVLLDRHPCSPWPSLQHDDVFGSADLDGITSPEFTMCE